MEFLNSSHCVLCLFCLLCLCRAKTGERELTVIDLLVKTSFKEFSRYILILCLVRFSPGLVLESHACSKDNPLPCIRLETKKFWVKIRQSSI